VGTPLMQKEEVLYCFPELIVPMEEKAAPLEEKKLHHKTLVW
jgi:hypothetical protein